MTRVRLCVAQGPLQGLTVTSAALTLRERDPSVRDVLVIGDLVYISRVDEVSDAIRHCAAALGQVPIIEVDPTRLAAQVRDELGHDVEVVEVISSRSNHPIPWALVGAYPDARKVLTGDGIGVYNVYPGTGLPQFDEVVAVVPQRRFDSDHDAPVISVVEPNVFRHVVGAARSASPQLKAQDADLAEFVAGGVLALVSYYTECQYMTLRGEVAYNLDIILHHVQPGGPVLLKSHPRASTGQTSRIARELRRQGREVRIFPPSLGAHPIELFERTVKAAAVVAAGGSSSAISLKLLYGVTPDAGLGRNAWKRMLPWDVRRERWGVAAHTDVRDGLETWDGRSVFELNRPPTDRPWELQLMRIGRALMSWREIGERSSPGPTRVDAPPGGWIPTNHPGGPDEAHWFSSSSAESSRIAVVVAAGLPHRVPRWLHAVVRRAFGSSATRAPVELIEEELEQIAAFVSRDPEPVELLRLRSLPRLLWRMIHPRPLPPTTFEGSLVSEANASRHSSHLG